MKDALRLLQLFRPYWSWMAGGVALAVVSLLANVGLMATSGWFITAMALAGASGGTLNYFTPAALIRAAAIARSGGRYLERLVTHEATLRLLTVLRVRVFAAMEPLAPAGLAWHRSGDLLGRVRADVDALSDFYLRLLVPLAAAVLAGGLIVGLLATVSPALAATTLGWLAIAGVGLPLWARRASARDAGRLDAKTAELRAQLVEHIQNLPETVLFGAAERRGRQIAELAGEQVALQRTLNRCQSLSLAGVGLSANLAVWTALLILVPATNAGVIAPAELAALVLVVLSAFESVAGLPGAVQQLGLVLPAARRLFELTDRPPPVCDVLDPLDWPGSPPDLECRGLSFRYGDGAWALRDVDLTLPAGGRLAVVGASGSGKTTLVNLLTRLWDCPQGSILLAGEELHRYRLEALRAHIAVVPQRSALFTGTIRDNLLLAAPHADQDRLEAVCRTAQIHDLIASQPAGYDTFVGEGGVRLSGGQARRIAVAQALLKDAAILLLDEPGEDLDIPTEQAMLAAVDVAMAGRSILLITHRPSGLEAFPHVVVLQEGRVGDPVKAPPRATARSRP
jgi:ATP-binding cassette subfamily C protein CydC